MSEDIVLIVATLTEKQKKALRVGVGSVSVCRALKDKGLVEKIEGTGMNWCAYPIFSRLGVTVRQYLIDDAVNPS